MIPLGKSKRPTNFYQNILGAFQYPFKRDGIILLVTGTIFFGGAGLFLIHGYGFGFAAAGFLGAFVSGYLFTYQQDIISTSVMGDEEMPSWPDFINVWDSGIRAWLELVGILLFCFGPAWACLVFAPGSWKWCSLPLALAGAIYWPMGLLAVTLSGSVIALNPLTVVLSILRVPLEYLVLCLTLGLLLTLNIGLSILLTEYVDYPMVTALADGFFSLYFMTVQMRLLGLLYYCKREALDWGF